MNRDRYDQSLSTGSERAAAFYRDGVDRMLSAWNGAGAPSMTPSPTIPILRSRKLHAPASTR